jgi:L-fucose isomerase-like protein
MHEENYSLMEKLRVKLLAFPAAELSVFDKGKKKLLNIFSQEKVEYVNDKPDILMFLTGGSERIAINSVQEYKFYLIVASRENNSWASATEVKAWMNQHNITSMLISYEDENAENLINDFYNVRNGVRRLHGQRLGLVGTPSDWLVSSVVSPFIMQTRLGIEQVDISWNDIILDEIKQVAPDFSSLFQTENATELFESGKIYEGLASLVPFYKLNALSVECFSLVNQTCHTACLALSKLNYDGLPAGCEGDTCSAIGLMVGNEVCGVIPWMANTAFVTGSKALFAHCTAPANLYKNFKTETHYETDKGIALSGELKGEIVTIFRLENTLSTMFITLAVVTDHPKCKNACRTQLEVELTNSAKDYFINNPFGNHHLILPGDWTQRLKLAAKLLRMEVVE